MSPHPLRLLAALLAALAVASTAQAALIVTPMGLTSDREHVQVGDEADFDAAPTGDDGLAKYRGKTLVVRWVDVFDEALGGLVLERLALDDQARGHFRWTIPEAVKDRNIFVVLEDAGEAVARLHLRVGDAEPIAFTLGGPGGAPPVDEGGQPQTQDNGAARNVPGLGAGLAVVGAGAALVVLALRRR